MRIHCCVKCWYLSDKDFLLVALFSLCNISSTVQPLDFFWFSFLKFSFHSGFLPIFLLPTHTQSSSFRRSTEAHLRNCPLYLQNVMLSNSVKLSIYRLTESACGLLRLLDQASRCFTSWASQDKLPFVISPVNFAYGTVSWFTYSLFLVNWLRWQTQWWKYSYPHWINCCLSLDNDCG